MKGNFKARCVAKVTGHFYTVGKVYEFKDGFTVNDCGGRYPHHKGMDGFEEWQSFSKSKWELVSDTKEIVIRQKGRKVVAVMTEDGKHVKSANAKCSQDDEFGFNIGAKLAFNRLMGEEVREVKRPAKVGEWIKIVDSAHLSTYKNGEILLVDGLQYCSTDVVGACIDRMFVALPKEYVVLENYQPKSPTVKTLADYTNEELFTELSRRLGDKQ